jgi:hypothetical protein
MIDVPVRKHDHLNLVKLDLKASSILEEDTWLWTGVKKYPVLNTVLDSCLISG